MTDSPTAANDGTIKTVCEECGWESKLFPNKDAAFEAAQDHQDTEHGGSEIEWEYVH